MKCRYDLTGLMDSLKQFGIIILMMFLAACNGSTEQAQEDDGEGKVAFGIRWVDSLDRAMSADSEPLDCAAAGVVTVHAEIYTEDNNTTPLTSTGEEGWDCEAHSGILTGVASGTNMKIVILGKDAQGNVKYRGEQTGITVTKGGTTTLEKVDAVEFSTELLEPDDNETVTDKLTLRWSDTVGALQYLVKVSANADLSDPVVSEETTATSYSPLEQHELSTDFIYYWGVAPVDSLGNIGAVTASRTFIIKGNLPPVLSPIGNKDIGEGKTLFFAIRATDPDGDNLTYSSGNLPTGAQFDTETGEFVWTPTYYQGGKSYPNVLFRVTDDGETAYSVSETITITVGDDGVNHPPELNPIGAKRIDEDSTLQFTVSAIDPDTGDDDGLTYSAGDLPDGASFDTDTHTFTWKPDYSLCTSDNENRYFYVLFTVVDDGTPPMSDSEKVTITVGDVNRPPVLDDIGNQNDAKENVELELIITATDADGDTLSFSAVSEGEYALPAGWTFDEDSHIFTWTPDFNSDGRYEVTFIVEDSGDPIEQDSETILILVGDVNRSPVIDDIGNKTVDENDILSFTVTATDPDGDDLIYSVDEDKLPSGAVFDGATQQFSWTPDYDQAGTYTDVTFIVEDIVEDNGDTSIKVKKSITITVNNVNREPVLNAIGNRSANEGQNLSFSISATDPDGDGMTYTASGLPDGATLGGSTGIFSWTPDYNDARAYDITFAVTDDGTPSALSDSETITITVADVNRPPVLSSIGDKDIIETNTLSFTISADDPDGDDVTYSAIGLPSGATLGSSNGRFRWETDYDDAGAYDVTFIATDDGDGGLTDSETITITVVNRNRAPVLGSIGDKSVNENATLNFSISATDVDGDGLTYSAIGLPSGASVNPTSGAFSWTTDYLDAGTHDVTFIVTDNGAPSSRTDSEEITITVTNVNRAPVLGSIGNKAVNEGNSLSFTLTATDPDTDDDLAYSATGLPSGATLNPTSGAFSWTPDYDDANIYTVTFTVRDDGAPTNLTDSEQITITVGNVNRAPVLNSIGNRSVNENATLNFTVSATDADGDDLTYTVTGLPGDAILNASSGAFSWPTDYGDAGTYNAVFTVTDDGSPNRSDSENVTITVGDVNRAPVLASIGDKSVNENATLNFTISATDPDGDDVEYTADDLPDGASLNATSGVFSWTTDYGDAGNYDITFTATDDGTPNRSDSETITITVGDVNRAPVLASIGDKGVNEGSTLSFTISATDPDGDGVNYSAENLPSGATFNAETQQFSWTPDYEDAGDYDVTFTATDDGDGSLTDSETITISVVDVNRPPVMDSISTRYVSAESLLSFTVTADDPDGDNLTFSADGLPAGADFDPDTQVFTWTPTLGQIGMHPGVTFTVTDDGDPAEDDSETITIWVTL